MGEEFSTRWRPIPTPSSDWGGWRGEAMDAQWEEFPPKGLTAGGGLCWHDGSADLS